MPYMPPAAVEEALARMRGETEDTTLHAREMRKPGTGLPFGPSQSLMPQQAPAASAPNGARTLPAPPPQRPTFNPAGVFSTVTARLVARGMRPADAARAAGLALRKRGIAFATRK